MSANGDLEYNRALDALEAGNLDAALEACESALMADANDSGYWQLYAVLLTQAGRTEDAAQATAKGQALGLDEVELLLMKAVEAGAAKNWNKAATACEKAIELDPERGQSWATYAANLFEGGYLKDSLEASAKAVELLPEEPSAWYLRGRILRLSKELGEAGSCLQKAVDLDPKLAIAWYEKGMVHHEEREPTQAKDSLLAAKKLGFQDPNLEKAIAIVSEAAQ